MGVAWGLSGVVAVAGGRGNFNGSVTIHNLCMWMAGFSHLVGAVLTSRVERAAFERGWWLLTAVTADSP